MHFTVQVKRTQHAELHIEAKDWLTAKLLARQEADVLGAFDEADTKLEFTDPLRVYDPFRVVY